MSDSERRIRIRVQFAFVPTANDAEMACFYSIWKNMFTFVRLETVLRPCRVRAFHKITTYRGISEWSLTVADRLARDTLRESFRPAPAHFFALHTGSISDE